MFDAVFNRRPDLRVNDIKIDVATDYHAKTIPIITSEVASGKTLLLPAICVQALNVTDPNEVVYVLQPTRLLANNAADNLTELTGARGNELVGVLNSNRTDDESRVYDTTKVIFTTVGYALSSDLIKRGKNFILDEAHELSLELSIVKAVLHKRIRDGHDIRVAIMSATLNLQNEMKYWEQVAPTKHYTTKGSAFPVEMLHRPAQTIAESVYEAIMTYGRRGILVFVSGVSEIEKAIQEISSNLNSHIPDEYEIYPIHGKSSGADQRVASQSPTKPIKIVVGTNVLETGISLPWVDAGVSSGTGKIMEAKGNVRSLVETPLAGWRITQQAGRTGRFQPGVFILNHPIAQAKRPTMQVPDIQRLPLTELVMYCAKNSIPLQDLVFSDDEKPDHGKLNSAIKELTKLKLVEIDDQHQLHLTEDGKKGQNLPLSYRSVAMYCEAMALKDQGVQNVMSMLIPLLAYLEVGDLRHKYNIGYLKSYCRTSDPINAVCNIMDLMRELQLCKSKTQEYDVYARYNVNSKRYREYQLVVRNLKEVLGIKVMSPVYRLSLETMDEFNQVHVPYILKMLARYYVNEMYEFYRGRVRINENIDGMVFTMAELTNTSCVDTYGTDRCMVAGSLRHVITKATSRHLIFLEQVTMFQYHELLY